MSEGDHYVGKSINSLGELPDLNIYYLAAPYSHSDKAIVEKRIETICKVDAMLMKKGIFTVSPLMKHFILPHADLPSDYSFWKNYSDALLVGVDGMIVIMIDGWDTSIGVAGELELAADLGIPIRYINENGEFDSSIESEK